MKRKINNSNLEDKCATLEESLKRALADYQNLKRRTELERVEIINGATTNLVRELLQALDNFELLLKHNNDEGLRLSVGQLSEVLKREGLTEIEVEGKDFDPATCEAVEIVKGKPGKVVEVLQKGYYLNSKLLRPARVKVGK